MKNIYWILVLFMVTSCNIVSEKSSVSKNLNSEQTLDQPFKSTIEEHQAFLSVQKDRNTWQDLITTKTFSKEENQLSLHYKYPYLNETYNPLFRSFNQFMEETYIDTKDTVEKVLENNTLSCDPMFEKATRIKRGIDYKVYTKNDQFLSVLLYKANYYDEDNHNSFMFKGLNYDLIKGSFVSYEDIFKDGSEKFLLFKLNQELDARIAAQDSFKECWNFTEDTFSSFKNNFVMNAEHVKFYFDDCVICPTYSGNYFLEIPIGELSQVLNLDMQATLFSKI